MKKTLAILLSLLLVFCLVPAAVFAEAPAEEEEEITEFTVVSWNAYDDYNAIVSVKINGVDVTDGMDEFTAAPGSTLDVEVTVRDGFELWMDSDDGSYFWWQEDDGYDYYFAGTSATQATLPGEEDLEDSPYIGLWFVVTVKFTAIDSVTINAPIIKEGEGYTVTEHYNEQYNYTWYSTSPAPEVTVPSGVAYEVYHGYEEMEPVWLVPNDEGKELDDFETAETDGVFEKGKYYYFFVCLYASDLDDYWEEIEGQERGAGNAAEPTRALNPAGVRVFSVNYPPNITVKNGELVCSELYYVQPRNETRAVDGPMSAYMMAVIRVEVQDEESAPTGDMNVTPWVWTMILTLSAFLTAAYYEIADIRRFHKGN